MIIETIKDETVITIPKSVEFTYLQDFIDYLTVKSIVAKSKATEKQITEISEEAQQNWWRKNKSNFLK